MYIFKRFLSILCLLACFLFGCTKNGPTNPTDILSDKIILNVSERLNEKYGFKLVGIGGAVDQEKVWKFNALYNQYLDKKPNLYDSRKIILDSINEFLHEANNNEEFRPYMKEYPFTSKNLSISIFNYNENREEICFPYISVISIVQGVISYDSLGPDIMLPYAQKITETFEEALNLSQNKKS